MKPNLMMLLFLSLIFSACTPVAIPATAISTPVPPTATMTMTPSPTATATPIAIDGVAEVDGTLYTYEDNSKTWVALPSLPEGATHVRVNDGMVGAYDSQDQLLFTLNSQEWEKVEAPIRSCADPRVIAEQDAAFTERTGIVLNNPDPADTRSMQFAETVKKLAGYLVNPKNPEIQKISFFKIGFEVVEVEGVDGISGLACLYVRGGNIPDKTVAVVMGWTDKSGGYHPLAVGLDRYSSEAKAESSGVKFYDGKEQVSYLESLPDGVEFTMPLHTFDGVSNESDLEVTDEWSVDTKARVREFLQKWGGGFFARMIGGEKFDIADVWDRLNPENGGPGLILAGRWIAEGSIQDRGFDLGGN